MLDRIKNSLLKFGPVTILTGLSQFVAAISLISTTRLGLKVSDLYSVAIQIGTGPFSGYVLGVVYLLAIGRPGFRAWNTHRYVAAIFSVLLALIAAILFNLRPTEVAASFPEVMTVFLSFGLGGGALAAYAITAVKYACLGRPLGLASVTIGPNAALLITSLILGSIDANHGWYLVIPSVAWAIAALSIYSAHRRWGSDDGLVASDRVDDRATIHLLALILGTVVSTVYPLLYSSAISVLKSGAVTFLFIGTRLGSSAINIAVNSVLLVNYNWQSQQKSNIALPNFLLGLLILFSTTAFMFRQEISPLGSYVIVTFGWLSGIIAAPLVMRDLNAQRRGSAVMAKVVLDIIVASTLAIVLFQRPSVVGFFGAYMSSQCATTCVCGVASKSKTMVSLSAIGLLLSILLVCYGW